MILGQSEPSSLLVMFLPPVLDVLANRYGTSLAVMCSRTIGIYCPTTSTATVLCVRSRCPKGHREHNASSYDCRFHSKTLEYQRCRVFLARRARQ